MKLFLVYLIIFLSVGGLTLFLLDLNSSQSLNILQKVGEKVDNENLCMGSGCQLSQFNQCDFCNVKLCKRHLYNFKDKFDNGNEFLLCSICLQKKILKMEVR